MYHSQQLLTLHILYFYLNFPHRCFNQAHQVCALRKLAHPVHLKLHRYVIPLSPPQKPQKKEPLGLLFCGGESVSFATTSNPARTLFFIFTSFHTIAFVRLIRFALQTCAPCAFAHPVHLKLHRYVIPLSPPQKKEPLGLLFCGGESGIRTHEALYGGLHDFESCAFNRAPPSLQLRLPFNNTLFYPDCKAFILTFQPLCLICHLPLYRRRYLPLVFLIYFSSLYSLYSLLFFFISFYFLYAHYIF